MTVHSYHVIILFITTKLFSYKKDSVFYTVTKMYHTDHPSPFPELIAYLCSDEVLKHQIPLVLKNSVVSS